MLRRIDGPKADAPGIIFVSRGVYSLRSDTSLYKSLSVAQGGILSVAAGVTLTLRGQLSAGAYPIFQGPGRVRFKGGGIPALLVDWFGAKGGGRLDDAPAINWALQTANDSDCEAVFSGKRYALGSTLLKGEGTRVFSRPGGAGGCEGGLFKAVVGCNAERATERPTTCQPACMHLQAIRRRGSSGGAVWRRLIRSAAPAARAAGATLQALAPGLTGMEYKPSHGGAVRPELLPSFVGFYIGVRFNQVTMVGRAPGPACRD